MKITHLTTLKHKLQWLLLLAALLGMGQEVWADDDPNKTFYVSSKDNDNYKLHLWKNGGSSCKTEGSSDELMTKLNSKFNRNYFSYDYSSCSAIAIDLFKVYHDDWGGCDPRTFPTDGRNIYDIQTAKLGYYFPDAMSNIILKGILEDGKVTCYVGCSWSRGDESSDKWRIFLNTANSTSNWYLELPSNATFDKSSKPNRYSAAMTASNVQYWITDDPGWSGVRMPSGTVAGNAYILGSNGDHVCGDVDDGDRVCVLTGASYSKAYFGSDNTATSLSITEGTASVTLTSTCSGTESAIGTNLKYHYYLKNGSGDYTLIGTKNVNATSALELTYNTSSLTAGTYYIYPLLVDATNATVAVRPSSGNGDELTLTVTSCSTPSDRVVNNNTGGSEVCPGVDVNITLVSPVSGFSYTLEGEAGESTDGNLTWVVNPTEETEYKVWGWDSSCAESSGRYVGSTTVEVKGDMDITVDKASGITPYEPVEVTVSGTSVSNITLSAGSSGAALYDTSTKLPTTTTTVGTAVNFKAPAGTHTVTVTATDAGCTNEKSVEITVGDDSEDC